MSVLGIIFGQSRVVIGAKVEANGNPVQSFLGRLKQTLGGVAGIALDASVSESHMSTCEVTDYPVEDGADVTDHVQLNPVELSIDGIITDTPLGFAIIGNIQNIGNKISQYLGTQSKSIDAFNALQELQRKRQPFTVLTGLKRYDNMILTSLTVPRTAETGNSIQFTAEMKEVRIVKSKVTEAVVSPQTKALSSAKKDLGQQTQKAEPLNKVEEKELKKERSWFDFLFRTTPQI